MLKIFLKLVIRRHVVALAALEYASRVFPMRMLAVKISQKRSEAWGSDRNSICVSVDRGQLHSGGAPEYWTSRKDIRDELAQLAS
jgi:hypothetical protein